VATVHRRLRVLALVVAMVAAGCAPVAGIEYDDPVTPPPAPDSSPGAFEVVAVEGLPGGPGQLVAVADGDAGAVAIGTIMEAGADEGGAPEALMLHSLDGTRWERVGVGPEFTLTDVAAGPDGFVAVGTRTGDGGRELTALVVSEDGRSWVTLPPDAHEGAEAYLEWVAAGPQGGYRAGGSLMGDVGGAVSWWSIDGLRWQLDETPVVWAVPAGPAWLESRDAMVRIVPGEAGTGDAIPWSRLEEPPRDPTTLQLDPGAVGSDAMVLTGSVGAPCGPFGSCAAEQRSWISTDGTTWRLLPAGQPGAPPPYVEGLAVGHDGELLALGYQALSASMDGWRWVSVGDQDAAGRSWSDVAVLGDGYVVVGMSEAGVGGPTPLVQLMLPRVP
jgi:hypothetical protein